MVCIGRGGARVFWGKNIPRLGGIMSGPNGERCGDCYFWDDEFVDGDGSCHRHAPRRNKEGNRDVFYASFTYKDDWCGEFKRKETPDAE
jgi:hypothetical protein